VKIFLALLVVLLGALWAWGDNGPKHTIKLTHRQEGRFIQFSVIMPQVDDSYRWLSIRACTAALDGDSHPYCVGEWERESTMEIRGSQHFIEWRDAAGRMLYVTAIAFDGDNKPICRKSVTLFLRG